MIILIAAVLYIISLPQLGAKPNGKEHTRIRTSDHYSNGQFKNISHTPQLTDGASFGKVLREFFFTKHPGRTPPLPLPSVKADLNQLPKDRDYLVWFGHSSYLLQLSRKTFLVDPVFSGHASPFPFTTRSFAGSDAYTVDDMPFIDFLLLTHDHYDHLDFNTVKKLKEKTGRVFTSLGTGIHLQHWGYNKENITELDWNESASPAPAFRIVATPARHFSGRLFKRNQTLWLSFVLQTPERKIFIGGDSGYDFHFEDIGRRHGPFDLALLECGQYNRYWKHIHMMPEEVVAAAQELKAKRFMPVHWGKFALSTHAWDEPIRRVLAAAENQNIPVLHPRIGEVVFLDEEQMQERWWEGVKET